MYASIRDDLIFAGGFASIKEGLAELGLNGIEMSYDRNRTVRSIDGAKDDPRISLESPDDVKKLLNQAESCGCKIWALLLGNNFGTDDLDTEIDWVISAVRAAERLGAPAIRIDAIMQGEREMPLEDRAKHFAECMRRVLDATSNSAIDAGIENHGFQGNDPDFLDLVLSTVNSPRVGMTLDTGNFYWAGHPLSRVYEIIEHLAPRVVHTHAKNINYPEETREVQREMGWKYHDYVSPLRKGDIDHKRVVQILANAGYDRDLCIEDESLGKFDLEKRKEVLKDDAAYFLEILPRRK